MDPITLSVLAYGLYKGLGKGSTPQAVTATKAVVVDLAQNLVNDPSSLDKITGQITSQIQAMNLTTGGQGYPGGFTAYVTGSPAPWMSQALINTLSGAWNNLQHLIQSAKVDGYTHDEAAAILADVHDIFALLSMIAEAKAAYMAAQVR